MKLNSHQENVISQGTYICKETSEPLGNLKSRVYILLLLLYARFQFKNVNFILEM